jgi:NADH:ubiquinone oxidoreductase subunit 4 (subunit M)
MLWLVEHVFFGPQSKLAETNAPDLTQGERWTAWPLAVLLLVLGVMPTLWLHTIESGAHPPGVSSAQPSPAAVLKPQSPIAFVPAPEVKR